MSPNRLRLGAVSYLNARPLVYGLERKPRFDLRYDVPSECARLLHGGSIDVGLIPSIEYLRGPQPYALVPGPAVTSRGPVASVALYTRLEPRDIRSVAMDSSSRTSVALATVMLRRFFGVSPEAVSMAPDLESMLARADAALIIGDKALVWEPDHRPIQKIDLGEAWTSLTGLPFVWAFWAGPAGVLGAGDVSALQSARDEGVRQSDTIGREYFRDLPQHRDLGARYLRDNIKYYLGAEERAGLESFYRYAAEIAVVDRAPDSQSLRFY